MEAGINVHLNGAIANVLVRPAPISPAPVAGCWSPVLGNAKLRNQTALAIYLIMSPIEETLFHKFGQMHSTVCPKMN